MCVHCLVGLFGFFSHPLTLSTILRARNFKNICFVTDSVAEPTSGQVISYLSRQCEYTH